MKDESDVSEQPQDASGFGAKPEISEKTLEPTNRTIETVDQAFAVCERMIEDWKRGISNAAKITAKINRERPNNQKKLEAASKGWKSNISTGFLATECRKVCPRLHMPVKTAKYLTAASLPIGWANGAEKTEYFRQVVTDTIRRWPRFNWYIRGLSREVSRYGFGFSVWFDEWEWRPTLVRMDKGFVPKGTEVMEPEPQFFLAKYDYQPQELLTLLRKNVEAERKEWKKDAVVNAIKEAVPPAVSQNPEESRTYEDLVRQATWGWQYEKGAKAICTYHLFAKELSGKVSHYILLVEPSAAGDERLLYENLDEFNSMDECVNTTVFDDGGDGTVHGSWGVGQLLYDLAVQVERIRNDSIDNMRMTNRMKLQVPDAKNVNDVKLEVNDTMMIVSGAEFAGNQAGMPTDVQGYELLDQKLTQIAQQSIGAFVPPIPLQPSDIKAAQINAALSQERELKEDVLENWLVQIAVIVRTITKRLARPGSPDETAKKFRETLLEKLTEAEIELLVNQTPVQSVIEFTEYRAQQKGLFAASVKGDPLFRQSQVARYMAAGVGDERFVQDIVVPEGDQSDQTKAARDQLLENASLALGQPTPVVASDNDWVHMQTMKPGLQLLLQSGNVATAQLALQHYTAHWAQGVAKKVIPSEQINAEKGFISAVEKQIQALTERQQIQQKTAAAQQQATQQAQQMVAAEQLQ